jgi:hypothetical protein
MSSSKIGDLPLVLNHRDSGFTTVAFPASVKRSLSSARRALARSIESPVVSIQPVPISSPVRTLPACSSSSCCSMLACSCLHQAMKRSGAAMGSFDLPVHTGVVSVHCGPRLLLPRSREGPAWSGRHMHQRGYQRERSHKPCENPGFHWNARPYWKIGKCIHGNFPPKPTPAETTWEKSLCSRRARSAKRQVLLAKSQCSCLRREADGVLLRLFGASSSAFFVR